MTDYYLFPSDLCCCNSTYKEKVLQTSPTNTSGAFFFFFNFLKHLIVGNQSWLTGYTFSVVHNFNFPNLSLLIFRSAPEGSVLIRTHEENGEMTMNLLKTILLARTWSFLWLTYCRTQMGAQALFIKLRVLATIGHFHFHQFSLISDCHPSSSVLHRPMWGQLSYLVSQRAYGEITDSKHH